MPYTPPHTFVDGDPLRAADINENLDELEAFLSLGIDLANDISDETVTSRNVLRPSHSLLTGTLTVSKFQTGAIYHIRLPALDYHIRDPMVRVPFTPSGWIAKPYSSSDMGPYGYRTMPGTWVTYYSPNAPKAVLVRYSGEVIIPVDNTTPTTKQNVFCVQHGGPSPTLALESTSRCINQDALDPNIYRRHISGVALFEPDSPPATGPAAGWNHVGLVAGLDSNFGLIGGFEITVEVFF